MKTVSSNYRTWAEPQVFLDSDFAWCRNAVAGFDYVAAMTRRCPNWIEAQLQIQPEHRSEFDRLLTENGLLMQAEEIAGYYRQFGRFPRIALLDDVLVHGRGLNTFLQTLLELLAVCLDVDDPESLLGELSKSLTLFMLATNDAPVLLKQEYQWGMQYRNVARENQWRKISSKIAETIYQADVANTSYVVSASQPQGAAVSAPNQWELVEEDEIPYRGTCQRLYVHALSRGRKAYPTVRSYLRGNSRYYTPYFFCGTLTDAQISRLFALAQSQLSGDALAQFQPFLGLVRQAAAYKQRWMVYFQLVNLLLGQITLQRFLDDAGLFHTELKLDTAKIARNFGSIRQVEPCLNQLCGIRWPAGFLEQVCDALEIPEQASLSLTPVDSADEVRFTMELAVYLQAVRHEAYAKSLEQAFAAGRGPAEIKPTGEAQFERFLSVVFSGLYTLAWEHRTVLLMLACLTQMMDRGDVCLKARFHYDMNRDQYLFDSSVRNTEMSLSVMPRNLGPYFPAFVRAAQLYQRDENFPTLAAAYLASRIPRDFPNAEQVVLTARSLARVLSDYHGISGTLLDWEDVLPEKKTTISQK